MSDQLRNFLLCFTALFVAIDVVGMVPFYVGLTRQMDNAERSLVLRKSVTVALLVALLFALLGNGIFRFLGISADDFRIAGGLILLLVSLTDLLQGPQAQHGSSGSTGIVPLAVPLITGPSVIATLIFQVAAFGYVTTLLALAVNFGIVWLALWKSQSIARMIGKDGTVIVSKIVALLLAAIAISMIRGGLESVVRGFK
ncbi:MAG: MarC family protein [Bdellovibrionales bacterium]|nr:MarC family protein [Bdellovibrionales bacterium]